MKILILGGNRFFGRRLAQKLISRGDAVTLLNRGNLDDGLGAAVSRIQCDRRDEQALRAAVQKLSWDVVFDQVAYSADDARVASSIFSGKADHYIFTSSQSVYGFGSSLHEEDFKPEVHTFSKEVNQFEDYAEAKRQCEAVFVREKKLALSIVRFPLVLGEDDYSGRLKFHLERVQSKKPIYFPNLQAMVSFIYSEDAARALLFLADRGPSGVLNVASADPISLAEFMMRVEQVAQQKTIDATEATSENHSPYGIEKDWVLNVQKIQTLGFEARPILEWLPEVMRRSCVD
jgi:nucleoside-diphosphate-sugar epimerase